MTGHLVFLDIVAHTSASVVEIQMLNQIGRMLHLIQNYLCIVRNKRHNWFGTCLILKDSLA